MWVKPVIKIDTIQLITIFNTTFSELNHTHDKAIVTLTFTAVRTSNLKSENELLYLRNTSHVTNDMCMKTVYCNQKYIYLSFLLYEVQVWTAYRRFGQQWTACTTVVP